MRYEIATNKALKWLSNEIKIQLSRKNIDDTGNAASSLEIRGNELWGADYLYYLDRGRGPGKFPPVKNIQEWVNRKLGIANKSIAYLIGRKISREGTEIYKDNSKGIELDNLVSEMVENLIEDLPDDASDEILTKIFQ